MPLSKSFSFNFRKIKNDADQKRPNDKRLLNKEEFQNQAVSSDRRGVNIVHSASAGPSDRNLRPKTGPLGRNLSFSVEVIDELRNHQKFRERRTLEANRLSKSFSSIKLSLPPSTSSLSVSQIASTFENRRENSETVQQDQGDERKSVSLSNLTPTTKKSIDGDSWAKILDYLVGKLGTLNIAKLDFVL